MDSERTSNDFAAFLLQSKAAIAKEINNIIIYNKEIFSSIPSVGLWLSQEMMDFSTIGKMLRGALALLGARLFNSNWSEVHSQALQLAAGLELLQAGLLVHDDIMDHDETRRGKPTLHIRLAHRLAETQKVLTPDNALKSAEAQGICVGDLFFFLAWKTLSDLPSAVSSLVAHEHAFVTLAQMRDVESGYDPMSPSCEEVLEMYRLKTARYTVALPLCAGSILSTEEIASPAKGSFEIQKRTRALETFGEALGIVFQLQDDRLGLFGDERMLGKPVGSDIKEGKKTPYIVALLPKLSPEEQQYLWSFFGHAKINAHDIDWLRATIRSHGVDTEIDAIIHQFTSRAVAALETISAFDSVNLEMIKVLEQFISYSNIRKG